MPCGGLGDEVEKALVTVGVTKELVERWLGECRCQERRERLNTLGSWARRVLAGKVSDAKEWLTKLMS